jgi:hypothetical protein
MHQPSSISMYGIDSILYDVEDEKQIVNQVELISNKPIEQHDLDVIIAFLENPRQSGGGNILEYNLDSNERIYLNIIYENRIFKQRLLANGRFIKFQDYTFLLNEPISNLNFKEDNQVLILRNIDENENIDVIKIYGETLILADNELNEIVSINKSVLFHNTYFIKFKTGFNKDQCRKRAEKRPTLRDRKIEILQAFETNTIVIKQSDTFEKIENYFNLKYKKQFDFDPIKSMCIKNSFLLIQFDSNLSANEFLNQKHDLFKNRSFEYLFNFDLIVDYNSNIDNNENENKELSFINKAKSSFLKIFYSKMSDEDNLLSRKSKTSNMFSSFYNKISNFKN